jgi:hypothetical protein
MTGSRRLQLAAEGIGTIGLALRGWRRQAEASDFEQPSAASSRWRVSVCLRGPLPVPGDGRHRWLVELIRARARESADFELEACDDKGRLGLSLRSHPVSFLRADLARRRIVTWVEAMGARLALAGNTGIVLVRQRPGSAKGVMFITLRDSRPGHLAEGLREASPRHPRRRHVRGKGQDSARR